MSVKSLGLNWYSSVGLGPNTDRRILESERRETLEVSGLPRDLCVWSLLDCEVAAAIRGGVWVEEGGQRRVCVYVCVCDRFTPKSTNKSRVTDLRMDPEVF